MPYNFDRNSRAFTWHYIFDNLLKRNVISRKEALFWNSRSPGLFQICQKYWTKRPNWEFHTQLIHRKTYSLEIHIYPTKTHAGYLMSYFSFHSFMQVYFCATVYIQKVWMVVHGFHISYDVFFYLSLTSQN